MYSFKVAQRLLDRLCPSADSTTDQRIWRFSERMAAVYEQQMERFNADTEAGQWQSLYCADNMPPPSDTRSKADVAAMLAFYSPTNFCKFQKLATQQLLEWHFRQTQPDPYPFGARDITLIDMGAGVGIASLALLDLLATWADVSAEVGYGRPSVSVRIVPVEPDCRKQGPRHEMLSAMSSMLDRRRISLDYVAEIFSPYPEPECVKQMQAATSGGSLAICCMSNFLSSLDTDPRRMSADIQLRYWTEFADESEDDEVIEWAQSPIAVTRAVQCADACGHLLARLPFGDKLLLAAELKQRGGIVRPFAAALHPCAEMSARMNHIRFYSPRGSYWHSLRSDQQTTDPYWTTGFWSLTHWVTSSNGQ